MTPANLNLLRELAGANMRAGDQRSILGALWGLVGPAATLGVLYLVFRSHFGRDVPAYPLYLLVGIVTVGFFLTATRYLMTVFHANRSLLLDTTVLRETLVVSNLVPHVHKLVVELGLCVALAAFYGDLSGTGLLLLAPLAAAFVCFVLGVGLVLGLGYCFTSDLEHLWMLASRLLFFVTPIFYTLDALGPVWRMLVYALNPLTPFVLAFRGVLEQGTNPLIYGHAFGLGLVSFAIGYGAFLRYESAAIERA